MFRFTIPRLTKVNINYTGYAYSHSDIHIYSHTKEDMMLFMQQHGFDIQYADVQYVYDNDSETNSSYTTLKLYHFKSNKCDTVYHIMTCEYFIQQALSNVASHISDACVFGQGIFRDDVEIIKLVQDLLDKLPHVEILDYGFIDGDWVVENCMDADIDLSWESIKKCRLFDEDGEPNYEMFDNSSIYDSFVTKGPDEIQDITIEAYVRSFTEFLISTSIHNGG